MYKSRRDDSPGGNIREEEWGHMRPLLGLGPGNNLGVWREWEGKGVGHLRLT